MTRPFRKYASAHIRQAWPPVVSVIFALTRSHAMSDFSLSTNANWQQQQQQQHTSGSSSSSMEDGLTLNLNFSGQEETNTHPKLDWRERKRQAHEKRNNRRQRGQGLNQAAGAPAPAAGAAAGTAAASSPAKKQKLQHSSGHNAAPKAAAPDSMHGYGEALPTAQPDQQQQQQQKQPQAQQQEKRLQHQQQQQQQQQKQQGGMKEQSSGQAAPNKAAARNPGAGASTGNWRPSGGGKPTVVKGALTKLQESAEAAVTSPDEAADIMALVALNLSRDQALQQEVAQQQGGTAAQQEPNAGVVEFGDVEDEPDYTQLAHKQQRRQQQQQQQHDGPTPGTHTSKGSKHTRNQQQQQEEAPKQQLAQHKAGELTHAEPNVPEESRLQLFGKAGAAAAAGVIDDGTWQGLGLSKVLSEHMEALNLQEPTIVQKQSIPVLLAGQDALVRSPTGSGKTLAYLAPMVHSLSEQQPRINRADGTYAVVLVPTRELAVQVSDVLTALVRRFCWLVPGILIGGEHRGHEKARLRKGVTVLVATPGRLMDHLENTTSFRTDHLSWLVLDEADRLLDLGFEAKLKAIIAKFDSRSSTAADVRDTPHSPAAAAADGSSNGPRLRQTVLLSATLHPGLSVLAGLSLQEPVGVGFKAEVVDGVLQLGGAEGAGAAAAGGEGAFELPQQLKQKYVEVDAKMRLVYLIGVLQSRLRRSKASKMVVFFSNCDSVEFHHELFRRDLQLAYQHSSNQQGQSAAAAEAVKLLGDVPVLKLHGDMRQPERTSSLVTFAKAKSCVLLCTDVAARGLDFPAVSSIIQYDPAGDPAEYVHRVGRTARMGQHGEALLFLLKSEMPYIDLLQQRGMQLQEEHADAVLRCLPALLAGSDPGSAGSVQRLARKLRIEAGDAAGQAQQQQQKSGKDAGGKDRNARGRGGRQFADGGLSGAQAEGQAAGMLLQRQLLLVISGDSELQPLALHAFRSFIRAYATHPSALKHVFHIKSLHLGHLAASFGLREAPTRIGASGSTAERKKRKAADHKASQKRQKTAWHKAAAAAVADG